MYMLMYLYVYIDKELHLNEASCELDLEQFQYF